MTGRDDTIAAIATARGRAALAIVRLSGPEACRIAASCFRGANLEAVPSHTAHFGYVLSPTGEPLDQVVATVFRAPRSYTGEDVVELTCHGGDLAPQLILEALLHHGARMAEPGEFTLRAFLNGKLDLAQAEAVADLIHAGSTRAHRTALAHLQGRYSEQLRRLRDDLLELCAYVELELDFSEEDVEFADRARLCALLDRTAQFLQDLLNSYRLGELLRDGVRVVIGGRPNAGKSTLLNALLGQDRAIVSPLPGTTRDQIEAEAEIEGLRFRFVDTAGLRSTEDLVESEGVRRAQQAIEAAHVLLYVFDLTLGLDAEEQAFLNTLSAAHPTLPILVIGNKRDLVASPALPTLRWPVLALSAHHARTHPAELKPLLQKLIDVVAADLSSMDASAVVMNLRHRQHLARALEAVQAAGTVLNQRISSDLLALELRRALHELGAITGEITTEDVLDQIFSRFCIGK